MCSGRHPCDRRISADMSSVAAAMFVRAWLPLAMKPSRSPTEEPFSSGSSGSLPTEGSAMKAGTTLPSSSTPNSGAAGSKREVSTPWEPVPSGPTAIWRPLAAVQYCTSGRPEQRRLPPGLWRRRRQLGQRDAVRRPLADRPQRRPGRALRRLERRGGPVQQRQRVGASLLVERPRRRGSTAERIRRQGRRRGPGLVPRRPGRRRWPRRGSAGLGRCGPGRCRPRTAGCAAPTRSRRRRPRPRRATWPARAR